MHRGTIMKCLALLSLKKEFIYFKCSQFMYALHKEIQYVLWHNPLQFFLKL